MTGTARPLVGRDSEIELLDRRLQEVCGGASRFVVVHGEVGIGKTSLLAEIARRAAARGCLTLDGRATELERELPFGPLVDALDAHLAALDPSTFAPPERAELAAVFPALRSLAPARRRGTPASDRFRAHHAVRRLLERLATRRPVVRTLDDLHWSDGASVELVHHLLRRPPDAPVLVVAAHRTGREEVALAGAVEAAARDGRVEQLELRRLSPEDAGRLLDSEGAPDHERLYRESGGNPFYLLQLARSHAATAPPEPGLRGAEGVPAAVTAAIVAELERLSEEARRFALAAAVAGDPFDLDLAVAIAALPEPAGLDALDELIAGDLVRAGDAPRDFRFRHPLVRHAVYLSCSARRRFMAHERAAQLLAERGAPAAIRAHHVEHSARPGDLAAVEVLCEAAADAAARAPHSAGHWFAAALRVLPPHAGRAARTELLLPLAVALAATGRLEEARAALVETLALGVDAPGVPRTDVVAACANIEQVLGRREEAHARLTEALGDLADPASADGAPLPAGLALDAFLSNDFGGMATWAERAVAAAASLDDPPLATAAMAMLAFAEANAGPRDAAQAHCARTAVMVDALSDEQLADRLDAIAQLAGAESLLDRRDDCIAHARRGLAVASASGQSDFVPTLVSALRGALVRSGRRDEAAREVEAAVESARAGDNAMVLGLGLVNSAYNALALGDLDGALRLADEAVAVTRGLEGTATAVWASAVHALVLDEAGDHAGAAQALRRAGGGRLERRDELFLAVKTVETHLRTLFRTFDASPRTEGARIAERESAPH